MQNKDVGCPGGWCRQCGCLSSGRSPQAAQDWQPVFTISTQWLKIAGHWLSSSASSKGRDTGHTRCICYPQMFYIPSLPTGQHRLKRCERSSSGEQVAATGATHLSHSLGAHGKKGGLCPCGWAVLVAAAHSQLLFRWGLLWCAGLQQESCHRTGPVDQGLCPTGTLLMKRGIGSSVLQVDNSTAPSWPTTDSCWKIFVDS